MSVITTSAVEAADGDGLRQIIADRTGTQCASYDAQGNHSSVGVGIAFDGTNLLISCYSDSSITVVDPADGSQVAVHTVTGAVYLGALSYDAGRDVLWACSNFNDIGTIDLTTFAFTSKFDSSGCFDGLAYDAADDTLWASADATWSIQHWSASGTLLSSTDIGGSVASNSGIAVGGETLYLANPAGRIYSSSKDLSDVALFASFPRRLEDLECDDVTFAGSGLGAIWSIDAYDNILNAWEIPPGSCTFGGGGGGGDESPPTLSVPDDITVPATSASGATVTFTVSAVDAEDPSPVVECSPASDSVFPIGTTTVNCTATDAAGNQDTGSFTVTVTPGCTAGALQQPVNADGSSNFKIGSTIPLKITLTQCFGTTPADVSPEVALTKVSSTPEGPVNEVLSSGNANSGTTMRFDATSGKHIYNLSTKLSQFCPSSACSNGSLTPGRYRVTITAPQIADVVGFFDLRK